MAESGEAPAQNIEPILHLRSTTIVWFAPRTSQILTAWSSDVVTRQPGTDELSSSPVTAPLCADMVYRGTRPLTSKQ